jgi:hypothetical protein
LITGQLKSGEFQVFEYVAGGLLRDRFGVPTHCKTLLTAPEELGDSMATNPLETEKIPRTFEKAKKRSASGRSSAPRDTVAAGPSPHEIDHCSALANRGTKDGDPSPRPSPCPERSAARDSALSVVSLTMTGDVEKSH